MKLSVDGVSLRYGRNAVLQSASFSLSTPAIAALVGANGAGKSTLLRIMAGVVDPDEGAVTLDGQSVHGGDPTVRRQLGYAAEVTAMLPELTPGELVRLVAALKRCPPPGDALVARLGVDRFHDQRLGSLSLGQKRRAALLAALVGDPRLLLLDEPTNGLDPAAIDDLAELLRELTGRDRIAIVATHDRAFAERLGAMQLELREGGITATAPTRLAAPR